MASSSPTPEFLLADGPMAMTSEFSCAAVFEIIKEYLRTRNPIPVVEAVRRILELIKRSVEPTVWKLFAQLVFDVVRNIPYHLVPQIHLCRLMTGIFYTLTACSSQHSRSLCAALDDVLKAEYTTFPPRRLGTDVPNYDSNVNVCAFAARLAEAQILKVHTGFVATALETAVGRAIARGVSPEELSARIAAAGMFIIYAGETIYSRMLELHLETADDRYRYWRSGPSVPMADLTSWDLWRTGFADATQLPVLNREGRLVATKATLMMGVIHKVREWT